MFARLSHLSLTRQSRWLCLLLGTLTLVVAFAGAADVATRSWADKMLAEDQHDFGSPPAGTSATHAIKISNIYKETVTISEIGSSTPDIRVNLDKTVLESKETAQLVLSLEPSAFGRPSEGSVSMRMTFDGLNYKTVIVPIRAFLEPGTESPQTTAKRQAAGNWAQQMFSELTYDFGSVARGAEAKHVIEITNLYKEDVTLSPPISSCGCITPTLDNFVLKSKQKAQLVLNLDTIKFSRKRDVTVTLSATFDNLNFKQIVIPIQAYIRQDVVFEPGSVHFGTVSPGEQSEQRVRVRYAGRNDWTIRNVRANTPSLKPEFRQIGRANGNVEYELLVKLSSDARPGRIHGQIVLETDDALNPNIPLLVDGSIEADMQITPQVVQFGTLKPGVPRVVNVVVKGRRPFQVEAVECDSSRDCYAYALPKNDKTVHVIPLTITPPNEPGDLKEGFTVSIAGRKAPLTFQAVGKIEAADPPAEPAKPAELAEPDSTPDVTPETPPAESKDATPADPAPDSGLKEPVTELDENKPAEPDATGESPAPTGNP